MCVFTGLLIKTLKSSTFNKSPSRKHAKIKPRFWRHTSPSDFINKFLPFFISFYTQSFTYRSLLVTSSRMKNFIFSVCLFLVCHGGQLQADDGSCLFGLWWFSHFPLKSSYCNSKTTYFLLLWGGYCNSSSPGVQKETDEKKWVSHELLHNKSVNRN